MKTGSSLLTFIDSLNSMSQGILKFYASEWSLFFKDRSRINGSIKRTGQLGSTDNGRA